MPYTSNLSTDELKANLVKELKAAPYGTVLADKIVTCTLSNLNQGDKITLVYQNDFGFTVSFCARFERVELKPKYINGPIGINFVFKPKGKQKLRQHRFFNSQVAVIGKGWQNIEGQWGRSKIGDTVQGFDHSVATEIGSEVENIIFEMVK